jgi:hypothetical protein
MPATNRTRDEQRLITINCGKVETFVVIENRSTHEAWWFLNLEHRILKKHDLSPDLRERFSSTDGYRSAGRVAVVAGTSTRSSDCVPVSSATTCPVLKTVSPAASRWPWR